MTMNVRDLIPWRRTGQAASSPLQSVNERHPLLSLHQEMNRLFDDVFRSFGNVSATTPLSMVADGWPNVEIAETERALTITAEVPGMEEKDIEVLFDDGVLTLRGERRSETADHDRHFSERFYGRFERRIPLGAEIDENAIEARFNNGLLTVTLPKTERARAQVKRIAIKH